MNQLIRFLGQVAGRGKLSILVYHQVVEKLDPMRPTEPTVETFEWHMRLLRDHFTPLPLTHAVSALGDDSLPGNAICVTFDDGYLNNLTVAAPILQKYEIPATVYVATGFSLGRNMWNDEVIHLFSDASNTKVTLDGKQKSLGDWQQRIELANSWLKRLKYLPPAKRDAKVRELYRENRPTQQPPLMMNPDQLRQLANMGVEIGAHTVNHPILKILSEDEQRSEIRASKERIESWIDRPVEHFAYPNGKTGTDFDPTTTELVKQLGFKTAVVTDPGISDKNTSPWLLKRFTPWDKTPTRFQLRLLKNMLLDS